MIGILKKERNNKIYFLDIKTKLAKNIFLGQKLNPNIMNKKNIEFSKINFDQCFSSPLTRCVQTAKIVCKNQKIITNNLLKEIDYGDAEGLNLIKLSKKYPNIISSWNKGLDPKFQKESL